MAYHNTINQNQFERRMRGFQSANTPLVELHGEVAKSIMIDKLVDYIMGVIIPQGCKVESIDIKIKMPNCTISEKLEIQPNGTS